MYHKKKFIFLRSFGGTIFSQQFTTKTLVHELLNLSERKGSSVFPNCTSELTQAWMNLVFFQMFASFVYWSEV